MPPTSSTPAAPMMKSCFFRLNFSSPSHTVQAASAWRPVSGGQVSPWPTVTSELTMAGVLQANIEQGADMVVVERVIHHAAFFALPDQPQRAQDAEVL